MLVTVFLKASGHFGSNTVISHDTGDSVLAAGDSLAVQRFVYPGIAVSLPALLVHGYYLFQQLIVNQLPAALRSLFPGVVAGS